MRWFLVSAVATAAFVLADPAPAKAQIIIGGNPAYNPRNAIPFVQFPRVASPVSSSSIPYVNGVPVESSLNTWLRSTTSWGYSPYTGTYAPYADPNYLARAYPANWGSWGALRPYNAPAPNWNWVDPRTANPGVPRGWFNGGGRGIGKFGKGK